MRKLFLGAAASLAIGLAATAASADGHAGGWMLDGAASTVAFGSVKKDKIGETHHFSGLSGKVTATGDVSVDIDLASVETWIDIRNERVREHVFGNAATATFAAKINMDDLADLEVGAIKEVDLDGTLSLGPASITIQDTVLAVRLSEMRVMVITSEMFWVSTEEAGIDAGIDMLKSLAKLPAITRAFPVTLRLVFDHQM